LDEAEQRLQRLEDAMANDPAKRKKKAETNKKENEVEAFIQFMKAINEVPDPDEDIDTDEFVQMMKVINNSK